MVIERAVEPTEELFEAVQRLVPQLGPGKIPPTRSELADLVRSEASTLLVPRYPAEKDPIFGILTLSLYRVPTGIRSIVEDVIVDEWISDSNQTPHIVVDASVTGVEVPRQYVQGGKIILNVGASATSMLSLGNDFVRFRARFGAATYDVSVPIAAVLGIYARETGQGMIFSEADAPPPQPPAAPAPGDPAGGEAKRSKPALKVVK